MSELNSQVFFGDQINKTVNNSKKGLIAPSHRDIINELGAEISNLLKGLVKPKTRQEKGFLIIFIIIPTINY